MIYILIIVLIIILLLCVVFYSQSDFASNEIGVGVEGFSNYDSIRNIILNDNNFLSNNIGISNYNGSIFERNNNHNFVFRQSNGKLHNFGNNLENFPTNNLSNQAKLFQNHDSYCIIDNNKVICFGDETGGGKIPNHIISILENNTVNSIYSTDKAFCALTSDNNIYCWGSSNHGGEIPTTVNNSLKNNVSKIFSNKDSFIAVYTNQKKVIVWGGIQMPNSLLTLKNVKNVFSNNNTFIILYEEIDGSDRKQKIKCFASNAKYILNKNNVENLENVKTIYSNSESFIVIYGDDNKLDVCGNNNFLGELMNEKDNIKDIVHVVTNIGAYCLLDSEGTIHVFGHNNFIKNLPEEKNMKNIKKLYANHGAFIAVNNDDTAFVFGLESHGYVSNNNIILNVKDVYVNGDETGGAILFIKKGTGNVLCLGHGEYGGNTVLSINSSYVKSVFSNTFVFYYKNYNNELKAIGQTSNIDNYDSNKKYIKDDSNIYSNNHILNKYNNYISDFQKIIDYDVDSIPTSPTSQSYQTTPSTSFEDNDINYYIWMFENSKDNITNTDKSWDIDTQDLNYTMHNSIMTKLDKDYPVIKFKDKTFEGDTYSISFNFKIDNLNKKFIVFSMLNLKLIYDDKKLKLLYKDTNVRNVNIDDNETIITLTFTKNEIKIYKNTSEITYSNNVNYSLDSNSTEYKLEFGNTQGNNYDVADFNISNLIIIENYKLNKQNVSAINANLTTFINEFNLFNSTTQVSTTSVNNNNEKTQESTTSSLFNTSQVTKNIKDVDLVTRSIFEIQNFLVISPKLQIPSIKLKIKSSENISFIKGQTDNNLKKLTEFKNKIKSESVSLYVKSNFNISKVDEINYRGLVFNKKSYSSEIDGKMYYIFELNNEALIQIINLKYLDIEQINRIYSQNGKYGGVYIMILGSKTIPSNPIFQIKDNIYIIVFVDKDNIYRYEQVRVDLNYFYNIFNFEFMKLYINEDFPKEINNNLATIFYENLQDNVSKNYDNIIFNDNDENILKSIVVNVFKNKKRSDVINVFNNIQKQNNKCTFNPSGTTLFECRQLCSNDLNLSCSETQCNNICNNCNTEACKWNFTKKFNERKLRPDRSNIKGFQGNQFIKVTWIKPQSKSEIIKYYIVITTPTNKDFIQIYSFYDTRELPEYIVKDLENGIPYSVSVISKNKIGVSEVSNIETVVPSELSELDDYEQKNTYDNSLQNYYNESSDGIDISIQKSIYEKQVIINELKDILVNNLKIDKPLGVYTVNIF